MVGETDHRRAIHVGDGEHDVDRVSGARCVARIEAEHIDAGLVLVGDPLELAGGAVKEATPWQLRQGPVGESIRIGIRAHEREADDASLLPPDGRNTGKDWSLIDLPDPDRERLA